MRKAIFTASMLLIATLAFAQGKTSVDPNTLTQKQAIQPVRDPRLDQKITYKVKLRPIADLVDELTIATGVTFFAGHNKSDWRVREDCVTVIATDIPLSTLMDSISHALHFKWIRSGKSPNWTYRLIEDRAAIAEVNKRVAEQEKEDATKRKQILKRYMSMSDISDEDLTKLRDDDPQMYLYIKAGVLQPALDFLKQAPALTDAWLANDELSLSAAHLSSGASQAAINYMKARAKYYGRLFSDNDSNKESVLSQLAMLEKLGQNVVVGIEKSSSLGHIPYIDFSSGKEDLDIMTLNDTPSESIKLMDKVYLRAYEDNGGYWDIYHEMRDQIIAIRGKEASKIRIDSCTQEPIIEHADDPTLDVPLKEKVASKTITGMVASLADASGFSIVTDNFRGKTGLTFDKDSKLRNALDTISLRRYYYNWDRNEKAIELWDVHWYGIREGRISNAMRARLRKKFQDTGTLDIDDLAEIASLKDEQINRSVASDDILRFAMDNMWKQREYLKIYASFTASQRSMLFSDAGLAYDNLNSNQQQSITKLLMGKSSPLLENLDIASAGAGITCLRESNGKRFIYTFKACTNLGEIPGEYHLRTPLYVDPTQKDEKKR